MAMVDSGKYLMSILVDRALHGQTRESIVLHMMFY